MNKIISIEPAIDPNARPTFLLDWELTLKCNLDCSYCISEGTNAGHLRDAVHPPKEECFKTIDFMFEYVDYYMRHKPKWNRLVVLNIYGGESLFHPDIIEILKRVREKYQSYQDLWPLTITCTTNGVVGPAVMDKVMKLIDRFTVSFHVESLRKQKQQVLKNLLFLKSENKNPKCIVLMHGQEKHWPELQEVIDFCEKNKIDYLPRALDGDINSNYNQNQIVWFKNLWSKRTPTKSIVRQEEIVDQRKQDIKEKEDVRLSKVGRACCGGRLLCTNGQLDKPVFYMTDNNFQDWSCSVNWYFLFIRQTTGEIINNRDCRMKFDGTVGAIGNLSDTKTLLDWIKSCSDSGRMPSITCARERCYCGLCAPKADNLDDFKKIMKKQLLPSMQLE